MNAITLAAAVFITAGAALPAYAQFSLSSVSIPRVAAPNAELRTARDCIESSPNPSASVSCITQKLTRAEIEKCLRLQCFGENNTVRQLLEGRLGNRVQEDFGRSDLGRMSRGDFSIRP